MQTSGSSDSKSQLQRQLEVSSDKIQLLKEARAKDQKEAAKKLEEVTNKNS